MRWVRAAAVSVLVLAALPAIAESEVIELESGEKVEGEVVERKDGVVVIEHATFGRLEIPEDQIKVEKKKERKGLFGTSFMRGWAKNIQAGFNGSQGKSEDLSINIAAQAKNQTETSRDQFDARYYLSQDGSSTSDNQFRSSLLHDFLIREARWFPFLGGIYRWDGEQDWDHRLTGNGGLGYEIVKREDLKLRARLGLGVTQTWGDNRKRALVGSPPNQTRTGPRPGENPERTDFDGLAGVSLDWTIVEGVLFTASHVYSPVLNGLPDFRNRSVAELKVDIGYVEGLGLVFGGSFDYDSTLSGPEQRDGKYYGNLVYDF